MIFFFGGSLVFFSIGLYRLKGPVSVTYLAYGSMAKGVNYLAFPFSLTLLLWGLGLLPIIPNESKMVVLMIGVIAPILLAFPALKYLKPKWLQWLEQNHKDIIPILQIEIQKMGPDAWDKQINTKEELESWVHEIKKSRGMI